MLRFAIQIRLNSNAFPWGTLAVNLAGCFIIGLLYALVSKELLNDRLNLLLAAGFCGGFTTFSALSAEGLHMIRSGHWSTFFIYGTISVAGGLAAAFSGFKLFSS
jgi:CrcB protein